MTIGTAIVVVMLLYLLEKHGKLKLAAAVVGILAASALLWAFAYPRYQDWKLEQYTKQHVKMKDEVISKYSVHLDFSKAVPIPAGATIGEAPKLPPGVVLDNPARKEATVPQRLTNLCKEASFNELTEDEKDEVLKAVWPESDIFDRIAFVQNCKP